MKTITDVNTGEVKIAQAGVALRALAIGSCIVAAVVGRNLSVAGMAHIMLPGSRVPGRAGQEVLRYAENAVDNLDSRMRQMGCSIESCEVFLFGAGNVLAKADDKVCRANTDSVLSIIGRRNLRIRGAVLGGFQRKGVIVDIRAGTVIYSVGDCKEQLLWQWKPTAKGQGQA